MDIHVKRIYETASSCDGARFLIDRLWPRGISKDNAQLTDWLKALTPSDELRKRFHDGGLNWHNFASAYEAELGEPGVQDALETLRKAAADGPVTLLFASKETERNNATVLRDYLLKTA